MRIGFITNCLVKQGIEDLDTLALWAVENGFDDLEVGPSVPLEEALYKGVMNRHSIQITALTYCRNFLSSDEQEAACHIAELEKRIEFAGSLGIEKIVTSTGIDKTVEEGIYDSADSIRKIPARSLDAFECVFTPMVRLAEENGVKIAFENCPLMGNIAISPVMWRQIFKRIDSPNVGIAYDPSHLLWQMIDPYGPVAEFGTRIFHVHAKDTRIDREVLAQCGILTDFSWWDYCIPGHGEIDWRRLLNGLKEVGYDGTISIEHEDRYYEGSLEAVQRGLILGQTYLQEFL